eukprot:11172731-Lingulodinium_polyedra.AAC.1
MPCADRPRDAAGVLSVLDGRALEAPDGAPAGRDTAVAALAARPAPPFPGRSKSSASARVVVPAARQSTLRAKVATRSMTGPGSGPGSGSAATRAACTASAAARHSAAS